MISEMFAYLMDARSVFFFNRLLFGQYWAETGILLLHANVMFKRKKENVDRHGPKQFLNNSHLAEPPCASLYSILALMHVDKWKVPHTLTTSMGWATHGPRDPPPLHVEILIILKPQTRAIRNSL
jgi:hypothetical protein